MVAWAIDHYQLPNVVLDPVMVATSGDRLIAAETVQVLVRELFPRAIVVTPNLDEAALLIGHAIDGVDALDDAAERTARAGRARRAAQGRAPAGRRRGDLLAEAGGERLRLSSARIASRNLHGTGCTLSSAIAAHLALGCDACRRRSKRARGYVVGRDGGRRGCEGRRGPWTPQPRLCASADGPPAAAGRVIQASTKVKASVGRAEPN